MDDPANQDANPITEDSFYRQSINFYLNYCKYYPTGGMRQRHCDAGVSFENVKIPKQPYSKFPHKRLDRYPCFKSDNCCPRCPYFAERDEVDAIAYANKLVKFNKEYVENLRAQSSKQNHE